MNNKLKLASAILFLILLTILGIQTYRVQTEKNAHAATRLNHQKTLLGLQEEAQREKDNILRHIQAQLEEKNANISQLQEDMDKFTATHTESERLQRDLRARLRQAELRAVGGTSTDAQEATRVCTELSGKLQTRSAELERRAAIYARYADRLEIELNACASTVKNVVGSKK